MMNVLREIDYWIMDYEEKNQGKLPGMTHP